MPLPRETVLCRQPCYHEEANPDKETSSAKPMSPQIDAHPQRDRLVAILRQREAQIKFLARQTKAQQTLKPKVVPIKPKVDPTSQIKAKLLKTPMPPVQPDPSIARPPWAFLQPLGASG